MKTMKAKSFWTSNNLYYDVIRWQNKQFEMIAVIDHRHLNALCQYVARQAIRDGKTPDPTNKKICSMDFDIASTIKQRGCT